MTDLVVVLPPGPRCKRCDHMPCPCCLDWCDTLIWPEPERLDDDSFAERQRLLKEPAPGHPGERDWVLEQHPDGSDVDPFDDPELCCGGACDFDAEAVKLWVASWPSPHHLEPLVTVRVLSDES